MPLLTKYAAAAAMMLAVSALAVQGAAAFDANNKAELEKFIHDYIVSHPEVLLEAQDALQAKQEAAQRKQAKTVIAGREEELFHSPGDLVVGNPEGDVSIVEFFDYNCPYCKNAIGDMNAIVGSDGNVRYVLKEFPILGPDSVAATRVSMAFEMVAPDEFRQFHETLLGSSGRATEASALAVAEKLGVDRAKVKAKMDDPSIDARIKQSYALANALHITGTPAYVVGDEAVSGVVGATALEQKIENVRKCNSTVC
ncbi:MAG TPA: DsbA family protein [Pararhizobium sp.]|nr:DsbA family protein [Pararhizobium sp.]